MCDTGQVRGHILYGGGGMVGAKKKNKGVCIGLVIGNKGESILGGIYPALSREECRMISLDTDSKVPDVIEFANTLVNTFIEVDKQWKEKFRGINN